MERKRGTHTEDDKMNKFIGGLLVATLLARPAMLRVDFLAYEVYKAQSQLLAIVKKYEDERLQIVDADDIDNMLVDIDKNRRCIRRLLGDKNTVYGHIQTTMHVKARARATMTDQQIDSYQAFTAQYEEESSALSRQLSDIEQKMTLQTIKTEIARNDTDLTLLYKELKSLNDSQYDTIFGLTGLIEKGHRTLAAIS